MACVIARIKEFHTQLINEGFDIDNKDEMRKRLLDMYNTSNFEPISSDRLERIIEHFIKREYSPPLEVERLIPFDTSLFMYSVKQGVL